MKLGVLITGCTALAAMSAPAFAQDSTTVVQTAPPTVVQPAPVTTVQTTAAPTPVAQTTTTSGPLVLRQKEESESGAAPNTTLLTTGVVMLGGLYVASLVVGASSGNPNDHHLYVPLAGPWMDIGSRGGCPANSSCDGETTSKILLGADGVFQALGALQIIGAFLMPETRTVQTVHSTALNADVTFTPARIGYQGYGFAALASF